MEPAYNAAERLYYAERGKLVKPVMRETTQAEIEAIKKMTIADLRDGAPLGGAAHEYAEALRAYNKAEAVVRRKTGFTKIDRAYEGQLGRVSKAANNLLRCPAETLDDLATKVRVHRVWEYDGDDFEYIMADIARVAGKGGAS